MMDHMDDVLIECDEIEYNYQPSTSTSGSTKEELQLKEITTPHDHPKIHQTPDRHGSRDGAIANAIMMYSPDIPGTEGKNAYDTKTNFANYYTTIETEETVKCVISTALFFAVVIAIILVALLENPMM